MAGLTFCSISCFRLYFYQGNGAHETDMINRKDSPSNLIVDGCDLHATDSTGLSGSQLWGMIHIPVIILSAKHGWTPIAYRVFYNLAILADYKTGRISTPRSQMAKVSQVAESTISEQLRAFMNDGILRLSGKDGRTNVYTLVPYVDLSGILAEAKKQIPAQKIITTRWGKIHSDIISISARHKWTAEKHRTYLACVTFASRELNGEFWAAERLIATIACNANSTVHKHLQQLVSEKSLISNGMRGRAKSYIVANYTTPASGIEAAETLVLDAGNGGNTDRSIYNIARPRTITTDRCSTAAMIEAKYPKSPGCEQYPSVESENASKPEPASCLRLDAKILEMPTELTKFLNSSRSERTKRTDLPKEPDPVTRTGGGANLNSFSPAAVRDSGRTENEQDNNSPIRQEWLQACEDNRNGSGDETQTIFNALFTMFQHRPKKCGRFYSNHEDAAKKIAPYLCIQDGWQLFAEADIKSTKNYLGWCVKMAHGRGAWSHRKTPSHSLSPEHAHEVSKAKKEIRLLNKMLAAEPEDLFALERMKEVQAILARHGHFPQETQATGKWARQLKKGVL